MAQVCRQLSMVIGFGISSATAIMIGKAIGEKKEDLAREYGKKFVKIAIVCGIGGGLLILAISSVCKKYAEPDAFGKELSNSHDVYYVLLCSRTIH